MIRPTFEDLQTAPWIKFHKITSTNRFLLNSRFADAADGLTCSSDIQTAGIGSHGKKWESPAGGLYLSILLKPVLHPRYWSLLSLVAGVAMVELIERHADDLRARLKWPNDLLVRGRKIGGILLQSIQGSSPRLIIGIGINVMADIELPDDEEAFHPTSIVLESSETPDLSRMIADCRVLIFQHYLRWLDDPHYFCRLWNAGSATLHKTITIAAGDERVTGIDQGVDEWGRLKIKTFLKIASFSSGSILEFSE
jgi:BirA family transcriptional regulator, biotin operon repressor / biotin---[acetyl-CoA-carboxylase] ligase